MTLGLLEAATTAVQSYIEANMPAKVADLNARYSDTLAAIATYVTGELPSRLPATPAIVVRGSGFTPTIQRAANMEIMYQIDVVLFVSHDDPERRWTMICRYVIGLVELLRLAQTAAYRIRLSGAARLTEAIEAPDFVQGFIIPLAVDTAESF